MVSLASSARSRRRRCAMVSRLHRILQAALVAQAVALVGSAALAAVPHGLTDQGRLFDSAGGALQGTVSITFSLYAAPSGGAPLWTETQSIALDEGYFSAQLGAVT